MCVTGRVCVCDRSCVCVCVTGGLRDRSCVRVRVRVCA